MEPLLKWPGGKRRLAQYICKSIGKIPDDGRYIELFAGSAAVFFHLMPKNAVLVDVCKPVIYFYEAIQREPEVFCDELERLLELPHSEETYNQIKRQWNGSDFGVRFAAQLLYLNKLGFNGLFRLNQKSEFNVAWGKKKKQPAFPSRETIMQASDLLKGAKLYAADYSNVLRSTHKNDVVYADPPYYGTYDRYSGFSFKDDDHKKLALGLLHAVERGVDVYASNIDNEAVRQMYSGWSQLEVVSLLHKIGCTSESRKKVDELFIVARGSSGDPRQMEFPYEQ
jgi:DNA adenine methylase